MYITHFEPRINGRKYVVYCISEKTKNGFRHKAVLGDNQVKINYYNRTWETFMFESVLRKLMNHIFGKDGYDYSKSKRGRKIRILPSNMNELIDKFGCNDRENIDLVYPDSKEEGGFD